MIALITAEPPDDAAPARHLPAAPPARVLLVEDSAPYARLVAFLLEDALGAAVVLEHAATLAAGLAALDVGAPAAVLLDLSLPDAHGPGMVDRVRAAHPEVPVLVLTGRDDPGLAEDLALRGATLVRKGDGAALTLALARLLPGAA